MVGFSEGLALSWKVSDDLPSKFSISSLFFRSRKSSWSAAIYTSFLQAQERNLGIILKKKKPRTKPF
jgi:hypothetical protein